MRHLAPEEAKLLPAYSLADAARYLDSKASTLRTWLHGRGYTAGGQKKWSGALLASRRRKGEPISFLDLVEAHVLLAIRRGYKIPMSRLRTAMDYLKGLQGDLHFLAHHDFYHDRKNLFLEVQNRLISLSERGQVVDKTIIAEGLQQIDYGTDGYASRFYPRFLEEKQKLIMLDPSLNFGRPCLVRTGVGADAIAERFRAGEKITELAQDYAAKPEEIEEAIRWHDRLAA